MLPSKIPTRNLHVDIESETDENTTEKEELFSEIDQSELDEWASLGFHVSPETMQFGYDGR